VHSWMNRPQILRLRCPDETSSSFAQDDTSFDRQKNWNTAVH